MAEETDEETGGGDIPLTDILRVLEEKKEDSIQDNMQNEVDNAGCCDGIGSCCDWDKICPECQHFVNIDGVTPSPPPTCWETNLIDTPESCTICKCVSGGDDPDIERCTQCKLLNELDIKEEDHLEFTEDNVGHLILSISLSPITWLWIPLLGKSTIFIFITLIITITMFIIGLIFRNNLKGHKPPFGLTAPGYLFITFITQFILNLSLLIEMFRFYVNSDINIVYQCYYEHFEDDTTKPPNQCMVYLDILGNSFVVFFASIYINVACMRTIKPNKLANFKKNGFNDIQEMNDILEKYRKKQKYGVDTTEIIAELEHSFKQIKTLLVKEVNNAGFGYLWCRVHCRNITKRFASFSSAFFLFLLVW